MHRRQPFQLTFWIFPLLAVSASGCATVRTGTGDQRELNGEELRLIYENGRRTTMRLVKNDSAEGTAFLKKKSAAVNPRDPALGILAERMFVTVMAENGVGIAAPQVGVHRRVILVKRVDLQTDKPYVAYFNPVLKNPGKETVIDWEGCLSIPEGFGRVARTSAITVEYDTVDGTRASERVEGFVARIFQHEVDHLDGILFIDRKEPGKLIPKEKYKEIRMHEKSVACVMR